jgi:uncharacterized protein YydD (DUF2326 family)
MSKDYTASLLALKQEIETIQRELGGLQAVRDSLAVQKEQIVALCQAAGVDPVHAHVQAEIVRLEQELATLLAQIAEALQP